MKENYVQNLPLEHVEQGCSDSLGVFFYRIWKETGGRMPGENSPIVEYLPKLVILKTIHSLEDSPDILFVGELVRKTLAPGRRPSERSTSTGNRARVPPPGP